MRFPFRSTRWTVVLMLLTACTADQPDAQPAEAAVRSVVEEFGQHMKSVSLLAPDSIVAGELERAYDGLVTADLLVAWQAEPATAPGSEVSSPWPDRIEVRTIEPLGPDRFRVEGEVVYATSVELARGGAAAREPVTIEVSRANGEWRISDYEG